MVMYREYQHSLSILTAFALVPSILVSVPNVEAVIVVQLCRERFSYSKRPFVRTWAGTAICLPQGVVGDIKKKYPTGLWLWDDA